MCACVCALGEVQWSILIQLDEDQEASTKRGLESVSAWSLYLLQDCLNMANSNGFVLGEECSRVQLK